MRILKLKTNDPDLSHPEQKMEDVPQDLAYRIARRLNDEQNGVPFYYRAMPDEVDYNIAL